MASHDALRAWTSPADLRIKINRRWDRGHLLVPPLGEALFPMRLALRGPQPAELAARYPEVQAWIDALHASSRIRLGHGYDLDIRRKDFRQVGGNDLPVAAIVPTVADAIAFLGRQEEQVRWQDARELTRKVCPALLPWSDDHPLAVVERATTWPHLLAVVAWRLAHARPGIHLRQLDLPGIDSKFIETNESILRSLLDAVLPADTVLPVGFAERYGFLAKPRMLRFRFLDPSTSIAGLRDISAPVDQVAGLAMSVRRVVITENEINGLTFPPLTDAVIVSGLGYGIERLSLIPWIARSEVWYWGDLDTHGFAILDQLRRHLPGAQSLLMDTATLHAHRDHWGREPTQTRRMLSRLADHEQEVYQALLDDRWGPQVRLEQERIAFHAVENAIQGL